MNREFKYSISWLDYLVTVSLNPTHKDYVDNLCSKELERISLKIQQESDRIKLLIQKKAFEIQNEERFMATVRKYQDFFINLLDSIIINQNLIKGRDSNILNVYEKLQSAVDDIFLFIETRFSAYLGLDVKVPISYLSSIKSEFARKIEGFKKQSTKSKCADSILNLVINNLHRFVKSSSHQYDITFGAIRYKRELFKGILEQTFEQKENCCFKPMEELLIYLNYNSKKFIDLLTARLAEEINTHESPVERMDKLLYYYKAFNQLHRKPDVKLNPKYHDLDIVIGNWFVQEILYLEKKLRLFVIPLQGNAETKPKKTTVQMPKQKILGVLSTDQMALILRTTDDLRIIHAKSLNEVFRTIAPHL